MEKAHMPNDCSTMGEMSIKKIDNDDDRISQCPDEILIIIISFLSLKEAGATSILSPRWKHLWKHVSRLIFKSQSVLDKISEDNELLVPEGFNYVRWVNKVTDSCKALKVSEFSVCFMFGKMWSPFINEWLKFAFAHQVEKLELDLLGHSKPVCRDTYDNPNYEISEKFFTIGIDLPSKVELHSDESFINLPPTPFNFESLKVLTLKYVDVSNLVMSLFLLNCQSLEELVVWRSNSLTNLQILAPCHRLKHLEVRDCPFLLSIKVCDINLQSFSFTRSAPSDNVKLLLQNLPVLVEVSVTAPPSTFFDDVLPILSSYQFQLEVLTLCGCKPKDIVSLQEIPNLTKLKKMVLRLWADRINNLLGVVCFVKAAPLLEEFVVELAWFNPSKSDREVGKVAGSPHPFLKVVKISGYCGRTGELELVKYFLENAVALERIIVDPGRVYKPLQPLSDKEIANDENRRVFIQQQLEFEVPEHIELVFL